MVDRLTCGDLRNIRGDMAQLTADIVCKSVFDKLLQ